MSSRHLTRLAAGRRRCGSAEPAHCDPWREPGVRLAAHDAVGGRGGHRRSPGVQRLRNGAALHRRTPTAPRLVQVTHLRNSAAFAPRWSPDSTHIAYWGFTFATGEPRLYEINADGSGRHLITTETAGYSDYTPSYTPDGQRIVFVRCRPDPPGGCAVYSVRADGADRQAITRFGQGERTTFVFCTRVSPDGEWVSFSRFGWKGITVQTLAGPAGRV